MMQKVDYKAKGDACRNERFVIFKQKDTSGQEIIIIIILIIIF